MDAVIFGCLAIAFICVGWWINYIRKRIINLKKGEPLEELPREIFLIVKSFLNSNKDKITPVNLEGYSRELLALLPAFVFKYTDPKVSLFTSPFDLSHLLEGEFKKCSNCGRNTHFNVNVSYVTGSSPSGNSEYISFDTADVDCVLTPRDISSNPYDKRWKAPNTVKELENI